jgi:hypothetical protein
MGVGKLASKAKVSEFKAVIGVNVEVAELEAE